MKCVHCKKEEVSNKGRGLCNLCYSHLRHTGKLSNYPKIYNSFEERLAKKYGKEILVDFKKSVENPEINLAYLSKKYKFTQAYAGQIAKQLLNGQYRSLRKKMKRSLDVQNRVRTKHPKTRVVNYSMVPKYSTSPLHHVKKAYLTEKIVWDKLTSLGFHPRYPLYQTPYDLIINDKKVEIKGAYTSRKTSNRAYLPYYDVLLTKKEKQTADYLIIYIHRENDYYCIPINKINKNKVYIPDFKNSTPPFTRTKMRRNRWEKYKAAWHLLK